VESDEAEPRQQPGELGQRRGRILRRARGAGAYDLVGAAWVAARDGVRLDAGPFRGRHRCLELRKAWAQEWVVLRRRQLQEHKVRGARGGQGSACCDEAGEHAAVYALVLWNRAPPRRVEENDVLRLRRDP